jgi:hypothetical protein
VSVAAASRLGRQLEEVIASLSKVDARFALIGGLVELLSDGVVNILVPRIVVNEFQKNRNRVAKSSEKRPFHTLQSRQGRHP